MNRITPWIPAFSMLLVSLISYIDRNTLAILAPTIREDAHMSETDYGMVISAFSVAYMIGNPVWGWLIDRIGLRAGMTAAVILWTIASVSHAFATDFWGFALARAALGFGEGATFPGGLRAVMQSLPLNQRARGVAIAYSGGSLGAIVAPLIVTPINARWHWEGAFLFTGLIGIAWVAVWQIVSLLPDIRRPVVRVSKKGAPGWVDPRAWAFMLVYALGGAPLAFIMYYSASYLKQTFSMSQEAVGYVLWIPPLGWEVGYFFWGWVSDWLHRSKRPAIVVERRLLMLLAVLSLPLAAVPFCPSFRGVMALKFLAMSSAAGFIIVAIAYAVHVYSTANSGLIAGLGAGAWGAAYAAASPLYGYLFDLKLFNVAFALASVLPVAGLLLWHVFSSMAPAPKVDLEE